MGKATLDELNCTLQGNPCWGDHEMNMLRHDNEIMQ